MAKPAAQGLMPKLETGMPDKVIPDVKNGFTLIEILIVMLIIGITLGFVVVSFGDFGSTHRAKVFAEEFVEYVRLLQYQSLLENTAFGIQWLEKGYQTFRLTPQATWEPAFERQLKLHAIPTHITTHLQLLGTSSYTSSNGPDIKTMILIIHPSGDLSPFRLKVGTAQSSQVAMVIGKHNGEVTVQ